MLEMWDEIGGVVESACLVVSESYHQRREIGGACAVTRIAFDGDRLLRRRYSPPFSASSSELGYATHPSLYPVCDVLVENVSAIAIDRKMASGGVGEFRYLHRHALVLGLLAHSDQ